MNLVHIFESLSDENRLRIVNVLVLSPSLCVVDLVNILKMPQTRVSRHLSYLKARNIVHARREGTWMYYSLGPAITENEDFRFALQQMFAGNEIFLTDIERFLEGLDNRSVAALKNADNHTVESVIQKCCEIG
ncbi:MAG: metalloregulator ArsR/SmtB family transcription factor [Bacteroidetes bacterium]|nr:metalloregulator ArsR/SmtB family transcription factor [Bacteroidota bacterium]MCH8524932.1 metalloregulator ArsR/SmtB family transcription factor [Balneolales bacterium]